MVVRRHLLPIELAPMVQVGAPTTGTWRRGTLAVDAAGVLWRCTTTGTPGTWANTGTIVPNAGLRYTATSQQTLASSVWTTLAASVKDYDTHNAVVVSPWSFTAPLAGVYLVIANTVLSNYNLNLIVGMRLVQGASTVLATQNARDANGRLVAMVRLAVGNQVHVEVNQGSGVNVNTTGVAGDTWISMQAVGP